MKTRDEKQVRYTLEDCLVNQRKLVELLKRVTQENRELRLNEREDFFRMLPKALLTQGVVSPCSMVIGAGMDGSSRLNLCRRWRCAWLILQVTR